MTVFTQILGYVGAALISIAFLPQTYKLIKTKDTKGLSLTCYLIYHLGLTFFIIYGSFSHNWPLVAANAVGWVINLILLALICYNLYQAKKHPQENPKKSWKENVKEKMQARKEQKEAKENSEEQDND
ncbi:MAG: SemiSWEET family transporter [Spiroplasma sp.]|nr:SemiSWEET family transporter [Spiroplasma sp.]